MLRCYILFALIFVLYAYAGEPSAFEMQSGVTKNDIKTLQSIVTQIQQKIDDVGQKQEGISSLYESQNAKLQQYVAKTTQYEKDIEELRSQLEAYKSVKQQLDANTRDIQALKASIKELSVGFSTLNKTILSELKQLNASSTHQDSHNTTTQPKAITFNKDINKKAEIFTQAKNLFAAKEYEAAKIRFEWLISINHKKADSYFYLGEIAFINKNHNDAIKYYKESVMISDKSTYMPTLLLHTAQSFNATKDIKNYNKFLDSLIGNYPTSKEAQEAKKIKNEKKEKK